MRYTNKIMMNKFLIKFSSSVCFLYSISIILSKTQGLPKGAPCSSLEIMLPRHLNGNEKVSDQFWIKFPDNKNGCFRPGEAVTVELTGKKKFGGFIIQARKDAERRVGHFEVDGHKDARIQCDEMGAVTHTEAHLKKNRVKLTWKSPAYFSSGNGVVFEATVVVENTESGDSDWHVNILSRLIAKDNPIDCYGSNYFSDPVPFEHHFDGTMFMTDDDEEEGTLFPVIPDYDSSVNNIVIKSRANGKLLSVSSRTKRVGMLSPDIFNGTTLLNQQWHIKKHFGDFLFIESAAFPDLVLTTTDNIEVKSSRRTPLTIKAKELKELKPSQYWRIKGANGEFLTTGIQNFPQYKDGRDHVMTLYIHLGKKHIDPCVGKKGDYYFYCVNLKKLQNGVPVSMNDAIFLNSADDYGKWDFLPAVTSSIIVPGTKYVTISNKVGERLMTVDASAPLSNQNPNSKGVRATNIIKLLRLDGGSNPSVPHIWKLVPFGDYKLIFPLGNDTLLLDGRIKLGKANSKEVHVFSREKAIPDDHQYWRVETRGDFIILEQAKKTLKNLSRLLNPEIEVNGALLFNSERNKNSITDEFLWKMEEVLPNQLPPLYQDRLVYIKSQAGDLYMTLVHDQLTKGQNVFLEGKGLDLHTLNRQKWRLSPMGIFMFIQPYLNLGLRLDVNVENKKIRLHEMDQLNPQPNHYFIQRDVEEHTYGTGPFLISYHWDDNVIGMHFFVAAIVGTKKVTCSGEYFKYANTDNTKKWLIEPAD